MSTSFVTVLSSIVAVAVSQAPSPTAQGQGQWPAASPVVQEGPPMGPAPAPQAQTWPSGPAPSPIAQGPPQGPAPAPIPQGPAPAPISQGPAPAPPSTESIELMNYEGVNAYWYAVGMWAPAGVTVNSLKMMDSKMSTWEEGYWTWDYYYDCDAFQFMQNTPYSPPFSFQATLSTGQVVEAQNVINTLYDGDRGMLSLSGSQSPGTGTNGVPSGSSYGGNQGFTADEATDNTPGLSSGEVAALVLSVSFLLCMMGALCFVCYRRKKVIAGVEQVEDEEVVVDDVDEMIQKTSLSAEEVNGVGHEQDIMIDVQITETKQ